MMLALVVCCVPAGCGGGNDDGDEGGVARARLVHALRGVPAPGTLDLTAGDLTARNLPLGGVTRYEVVSDGSITLTAQQTAGAAAVPIAMGEEDADLRANDTHTLILAGALDAGAGGDPASAGPPTAPHVVRLIDIVPTGLDTAGPTDTSPGRAAIRLVHVDAGSPQPLDLLVNGTLLVGASNITRDNGSSYLMIPAGEVTLTIRRTGEPAPAAAGAEDPAVVRRITLTLQGARAYTVFVMTAAAPTPAAGASPAPSPPPPVVTLDQ
jgi:hypothetical protein